MMIYNSRYYTEYNTTEYLLHKNFVVFIDKPDHGSNLS